MLRKKQFLGGMICYLIYSVLILETVISTYPRQRQDDATHNVTVTQGKQAILPCQVESNDNLLIIWMNPKRIVISERESRYIDDPRMSIERPFVGDYNLHIRNVRYDDRGEYTCTINTIPVQIKRIRLIVKVPSEFVNDGQPAYVIAVEGTSVKMTCNATGIPTPNITWFRKFSAHEEDKEQVGTMGEVLIIHNISRSCGGTYQCMAFNEVLPAIAKQIEVEVQFKPEITIRNRRLGQKKDKETMLECLVTASPQGDNYWKMGKREIVSSEYGYRIEVYPEDEYTVAIALRILSVQDRDFGIYTCEAKNVLGFASDSMELYEYADPTFPPTTTTLATSTRKYNKYRDRIRNKNQKNQDIERNDIDYDDKRYNKYRHHPDTQVSGHIGTGEYSHSAGTGNLLITSQIVLTGGLIFMKIL